ncbi:MAG TPA: NlpC/P60 family protein [Sphingomonas sp.]|nr:NlpC/P60 family protein [Sphingomonas sp.]
MNFLKASEGSSTARRPRISRDKFATSRPEGFRLEGPSRHLDPRVHAYRPDIADIALAGLLFAPHYARAEHCRCIAASVSLHARPSQDAPAISQLTHGEGFALLDRTGAWAWGRCLHDDYVGYLPASALGPMQTPTHRVIAPLALVFASADIKAPIATTLAIGAQVHGEEVGEYLRIPSGFIHLRHIAPLDEAVEDPVAVAESLIGAPYRWGGRGAEGLDCSGLVQRSLELAGIAAPRDSDMQRDQLGDPIADGASLTRGDLIFFPGHVGFMVDSERLIHANAYWMTTMIEPLADVVARLLPTHDTPIIARKRIAR